MKKGNVVDEELKKYLGEVEDEEMPHLTWEQLGKLIRKMSTKHKKQTVEICDGGHDVFGECLKHDKQGNPYIKGF